jgi:hypothetical protein
MPIESNDFQPFVDWFPGAASYWAALMGCLLLAAVAVGFLVAALRHGPSRAARATFQALVALVIDMVRISPRRVLALARLAVKESIRRRVVVVFVVFLLVMLFAGWFINPSSDQPARLYLGHIVFPATMYLTLLLALFLSSLSLPLDIKNRTLHTVVTKPVRQSEIVLGRILGFAVIGTVLLAPMGVISYAFTVRGLAHTHELTAAHLSDELVPGSKTPRKKGLTSKAHFHQHEVTIEPSGEAVVQSKQGHTHRLFIDNSGDEPVYTLGPPEGLLVARVPIYGKLRFKDRTGKDAERGVNVGDEWTYRSFIDGGTRAAAIWEFQGITPQRFPAAAFPDGIPLELTIEVFRSHKGNIEKDVGGSLWLCNPETGLKVEAEIFGAKKFVADLHMVPREVEVFQTDDNGNRVKDEAGRPVMEKYDLFRDLVSSDGRLEVWLQCIEGGQYFGMAQADAYFRARNASFALNFAKGYAGIWMLMVLVIAFGVMFSTFLSAPVAFLATLGVMVGGWFLDFMIELAKGTAVGGGPFESTYRLLTQQNQISPLPAGLPGIVAQMLDLPMRAILRGVSTVLPSFGGFDFSDYVSYGFDVSGDLMLKCVFRLLGFLVPLTVAGYFFLKTREVAK